MTISLRAALAIIVGAALFLSCHKRSENYNNKPNSVAIQDTSATVDTVGVLASVEVTDSLLNLGNTGYIARIPKDYEMIQNNDSSFTIRLSKDTCKCAQLKLDWNFRHAVVPGIRPIGKTSYNIMDKQVGFTDFPLIGVHCILRSGVIQTDETKIHIECIAPPGESMEQLCDIAVSLVKTGE